MSNTTPVAADPAPGRHELLWVGVDDASDLRLARDLSARLAEIHVAGSVLSAVTQPPDAFVDRSPAVILLASSSPGRWSLADAITLSLRWPLARIVSVAATIVDGRRRSGPPLAGVEEVPWHDLPGRLGAWLDDRRAGRPGTLGLPVAARREDGILASVWPRLLGMSVSVAAMKPADLEGVADLTSATGARVALRSRGRPPLDDETAALVWDVGIVDPSSLQWLRMLAANRPGRTIVLLESFPRAESTRLALDAGAVAVLGRPCGVETIAGALLPTFTATW